MTGWRGYRHQRQARRYRRAVRRAFGTVTFYREQQAAAGALLDQPRPTPAADLPDPPHTLCPFARPWSAALEPSLWTPGPAALARALRLAGCGGGPVLEVRDALLDAAHLPRVGWSGRRRYAVLLSPAAVVASPARRWQLNAAALAGAAAAGKAWVVGGADELAGMPEAAGDGLEPVHRVPVGAVAAAGPAGRPVVLHEPSLGYLGALVPTCRSFHLDWRRVYASERDGAVTLSLLRGRRPTLLDIVPPDAEAVTVAHCPQHGSPVLRARTLATSTP